jgi:hypothetical protein
MMLLLWGRNFPAVCGWREGTLFTRFMFQILPQHSD